MTLKKKNLFQNDDGTLWRQENEAQGAFQKSSFNKLKYTALDQEVRVQAMGEICKTRTLQKWKIYPEGCQ